jgi:hypothetical protein
VSGRGGSSKRARTHSGLVAAVWEGWAGRPGYAGVQMAACPADREGGGRGGAGRPGNAGVQMAAFPTDHEVRGGAGRPGNAGVQMAAFPADQDEGREVEHLVNDEHNGEEDLSYLCDAVEEWNLEACELAGDPKRGPPEPPPLLPTTTEGTTELSAEQRRSVDRIAVTISHFFPERSAELDKFEAVALRAFRRADLDYSIDDAVIGEGPGSVGPCY